MPLANDELISAIAAFRRFEEMMELYEEHKHELIRNYSNETDTDHAIFVQRASVYLILAIALLYTVLEYLIDNKKMILPESICDDLVELKPKMREFRNCVFHVQNALLSERQYAFIETPDVLRKMVNIATTIRSLMKEMARPMLPPNPPA